jgi:ferric-dicitrate binding protein FerR (iron transport regulator)
MDGIWSRRGLFLIGGQVIAGASLGQALERLAVAQPRDAIDWKRLFATKPEGGTGRVKQVTGIAFANQRRLTPGATVRSGEQLRVAKAGRLMVSIEDGTLLQLREGTVLDFSPGTHNSGVLHLVSGAILTVVPTTHRYLIHGPVAVIGVKGTVFYRQVFTENEDSALAMENQRVPVPGAGLKDYFCTCNGAVDYLRLDDLSLVASDTAQHHNAFILNPKNPKLLEKFPMVNHFDQDIKECIDLQDGPKHDSHFLKP